MITLRAAFARHHVPEALPGAVRTALGKPLRRASALTQMVLLGALAALPEERRDRPTALLWQSTSGARQETEALLNEVCAGQAEPMPYEFLATQPTIAAAQIQPYLPGLQTASHFPLADDTAANWALLLALAAEWLGNGRYEQVLCAHIDVWPESADGYWLAFDTAPLENGLAALTLETVQIADGLADCAALPVQVADWLNHADSAAIAIQSAATCRQTLKFTRLSTI